MSRSLRISFANAVYHITARGNRRDKIFCSDNDKEVKLQKMDQTFIKYAICCYAYCLMDNHYHFFINRTLAEEFYQIAMIKKVYTSLSELQDDLDRFTAYYNFKRTNQGYRLKGKIPYQKFFDNKRKYALPEPL